MMENDIHADSADESDDESDEYDVEEMNLHEIAHTDTPNKVKLEYILDEIQEDDDEDVATDGGVDMRQPEDDSHDVERGDEIVVDDVADSRQPMTVRVVYHSGGIKAIDQFDGRYEVSAGAVADRVDVVNEDDKRTLNDYVDLGGIDKLQLDDNDNDDDDEDDEDDDTDHWGQPVEHYDGRQMGAGEKCQCQRCASRQIALVAATRNTSATNWEEFYRCEGCGAEGSLRVEGPERRWTGDIDHPDVIQG